jgi:nucleotide-binding universal stress UspA family protein
MENLKINKILVPIDFSDTSKNALDLAIALCRRHNAAIRLIHVIDPYQYISISSNGLMIDFSKDTIVASETQRLQRLGAELMNTQTDIYSVECRIGSVSRNIIEAAHDFESDLIVLGTGGSSGFNDHFTNSVAYEVLETATCPVLTVPKYKKWTEFKKVLFPVRPMQDVISKYNFAREIIRRYNANLIILGLINENEDNHENSQEISVSINHLEKYLLQDKINADTVFITTDSAAETVVNKSQHLGIDLIVITPDPDGTNRSLFTGPYARQVINHAKVPVLSIGHQTIVNSPNADHTLSTSVY